MIGDDDWILYSDQKKKKLSSENLEKSEKKPENRKI